MAKGEEGAYGDGTLPRSHKTASHKIDCLVLISTMNRRLLEKKTAILKYGLHPRHVYETIVRHAAP